MKRLIVLFFCVVVSAQAIAHDPFPLDPNSPPTPPPPQVGNPNNGDDLPATPSGGSTVIIKSTSNEVLGCASLKNGVLGAVKACPSPSSPSPSSPPFAQ